MTVGSGVAVPKWLVVVVVVVTQRRNTHSNRHIPSAVQPCSVVNGAQIVRRYRTVVNRRRTSRRPSHQTKSKTHLRRCHGTATVSSRVGYYDNGPAAAAYFFPHQIRRRINYRTGVHIPFITLKSRLNQWRF